MPWTLDVDTDTDEDGERLSHSHRQADCMVDLSRLGFNLAVSP
jgi:hypothetical protein